MMLRRQRGALLLMVSLLLATIAALAFGLNRAAGVEVRSVQDDYDSRAAGYLAEAGFAAAKWRGQIAGCPKNKVQDIIAPTALGSGLFSATAIGDGNKLSIVAGGSVGGDALRSVARRQLAVHDLSDVEDDDDVDDELDTTIAQLRLKPDSENPRLSLVSSQSNALLYWSVKDIDPQDKIMSATLTLTLTARSPGPRQVALHRMTTRWDHNATWTESRPKVAWTGNDYSNAPSIATVGANATSVSWDVTSLVKAWVGAPASNAGILLRLVEDGQAIDFHGRKTGSSNLRPLLHLVVAEKC